MTRPKPPIAPFKLLSSKCTNIRRRSEAHARRHHMNGKRKGIPENSSVVMPRLFCRDVAGEVAFCQKTFSAIELGNRSDAAGKIVRALLTIGPAMIMIESEWPELESRAPRLDASSPVVIYVYVEDV